MSSIRKILIIDDENDIRNNIAEYLQDFSFKTITAENGVMGIQSALINKPDLIICDIDMPVLDGYEVYNQIQQLPELALTPFIFLTAKSSSEEFRKGMVLGADDYITKPFKLNDVLLSINRRLEKLEKTRIVSEKKLHALTDNQLVGIFFYQEKGFSYTNRKFCEILEYKRQDLKNMTFDKIVTGGNRKDILEKIIACMEGVLESALFECFIVTNINTTTKVEISIQHIILDSVKTIIGIMQPAESKSLKSKSLNPNTFSKIINQLEESGNKELIEKLNGFLSGLDYTSHNNLPSLDSNLKLSEREIEVLTMICRGKTNSEIAEELFLSNRTIEKHRAHLLSKTNAKNTAQLVVFGIKILGIEV